VAENREPNDRIKKATLIHLFLEFTIYPPKTPNAFSRDDNCHPERNSLVHAILSI
jgi:hypothetical protein